MSRSIIFCVLALLLLAAVADAARSEPAISKNTQLPEIGVEELNKEEEGCNGVGEEECLMRRTLVAHIDYIYTQNRKP